MWQYIWLPLIKMHKSKRFFILLLTIINYGNKQLNVNRQFNLFALKISKIQNDSTEGVGGGGGGGHTWPSTKTKGTPMPPAPTESAPAKFLQWLWVT